MNPLAEWICNGLCGLGYLIVDHNWLLLVIPLAVLAPVLLLLRAK